MPQPHNRAPTSDTVHRSTVLITVMHYSGRPLCPPPLVLVEVHKIASACCTGSEACVLMNDILHGLLQMKGGIAIAARLRRALQRNELRRKFHVGRGGRRPRAPSYHDRYLRSRLCSPRSRLSAFQRFRHVYRIETRCTWLSQSGWASQSPCSRPPHFPRHSWPPGARG